MKSLERQTSKERLDRRDEKGQVTKGIERKRKIAGNRKRRAVSL